MQKYIVPSILIVSFMFVIHISPDTPKPMEECVEKDIPLECKKELLAREYSALKKELRYKI